jgi:conjugative transfer signal peptidase TraF
MIAHQRPLIGAVIGACALVVGPAVVEPAPRLLFNTTASAPVGFYRIDRVPPRVGDWVVVRPPAKLAAWMAGRGYAPAGVPLLKRLAAVEGQAVCGREGRVLIDGRLVALARERDRWGRVLRPFVGCRRLVAGEVFLLNANAPDSLDGRYFGPLPRQVIVGRAVPLWMAKAR